VCVFLVYRTFNRSAVTHLLCLWLSLCLLNLSLFSACVFLSLCFFHAAINLTAGHERFGASNGNVSNLLDLIEHLFLPNSVCVVKVDPVRRRPVGNPPDPKLISLILIDVNNILFMKESSLRGSRTKIVQNRSNSNPTLGASEASYPSLSWMLSDEDGKKMIHLSCERTIQRC